LLFAFSEPSVPHLIGFCGQLTALSYFSVPKHSLLVQNTVEVGRKGVL
jgi:fluoride ion exporter CrcB/FEX